MFKKCNVNETFPDLEPGIAEVVNIIDKVLADIVHA